MTSDEIRALVTATAAGVLGVADTEIAAAGDLTEFPTYTSFRVLDIVEAVERRLGVEVAAHDLVPAKLRRIDSLCTLFAAAAPAGSSEEHIDA